MCSRNRRPVEGDAGKRKGAPQAPLVDRKCGAIGALSARAGSPSDHAAGAHPAGLAALQRARDGWQGSTRKSKQQSEAIGGRIASKRAIDISGFVQRKVA